MTFLPNITNGWITYNQSTCKERFPHGIAKAKELSNDIRQQRRSEKDHYH
jgi:hypothetical protein